MLFAMPEGFRYYVYAPASYHATFATFYMALLSLIHAAYAVCLPLFFAFSRAYATRHAACRCHY